MSNQEQTNALPYLIGWRVNNYVCHTQKAELPY